MLPHVVPPPVGLQCVAFRELQQTSDTIQMHGVISKTHLQREEDDENTEHRAYTQRTVNSMRRTLAEDAATHRHPTQHSSRN